MTAPFTAKALISVMQAYNRECGPTREAGINRLVESNSNQRSTIQGGLLVGLRYNNIQSPTKVLNTDCTDCRVRPFGGLYGELLLPGRTAAIYGELSVSSFRNKGAITYDTIPGNGGTTPFSYYNYQGLLSTARLGVRYFFALPHDQKLLLGLGLEYNYMWRLRYATTAGPKIAPYVEDLFFAEPTWLPNLAVGWRNRRFTISLDGQLYSSRDKEGNVSSTFFGNSSAVRLSTAYRLGRNHDEMPQKK
jgi:hypothetical protein